MKNLLCFIALLFATNCFAQVELDLEVVCETEEFCGQEYWDKGMLDLYVNDFNGIDDDSVHLVLIVPLLKTSLHLGDPNGLFISDVIEFSSEEIVDEFGYIIGYNDTIFNGYISASETEPLFSFGAELCTDIAFDRYYAHFTTNYNGISSTQEIQIGGIVSADGEFVHPCKEFIPNDLIISSAADALYYCNSSFTNGDEFCSASFCDISFLFPENPVYVLYKNWLPNEFDEGNENFIGELNTILESDYDLSQLDVNNLHLRLFSKDLGNSYTAINDYDVIPIVKPQNCVDLDLEVVCNTADFCGQQYWTTCIETVENIDIQVYLNDILNFNADSIELTIVATELTWADEIGISSNQYDFIETNSDTIFSGLVEPSLNEPLLTVQNLSGCAFFNHELELSFYVEALNGDTISEVLNIIIPDNTHGGFIPICPEQPMITPNRVVMYCPTDTFYHCNGKIINLEEFKIKTVIDPIVYDRGFPEVQALVFKDFLPTGLDDPTEHYNYVGMLNEEFHFDGEETLFMKLFLFNYWEEIVPPFSSGFWYEETNFPTIPIVKSSNCVELDLEIVCNTADFCGQQYWDKGLLDLYINEFDGTEDDIVYLVLTIPENEEFQFLGSPNEIFSSNTIAFSFEEKLDEAGNFIGYNDTIFNGYISASQTEPLFSFITPFCTEIIYPDYNAHFSVSHSGGQFERSAILGSGIWVSYSSGNWVSYNYESILPCTNGGKGPHFIYDLPNTLYLCGNSISNADEICIDYYCITSTEVYEFALFRNGLPAEVVDFESHADYLGGMSSINSNSYSAIMNEGIYIGIYVADSLGLPHTLWQQVYANFELHPDIDVSIDSTITICLYQWQNETYTLPNGQEVYFPYNNATGEFDEPSINSYAELIETDSACDSIVIYELDIRYRKYIPDELLKPDTLILFDGVAGIIGSTNLYGTFYWVDTGETTNTIEVSEAGVYTLEVSSGEEYCTNEINYVVLEEFTCATLSNETNLNNQSICLEDTLTIFGEVTTFNETGSFSFSETYTNQYECDSVVNQQINVFELPTISISQGEEDTITSTNETYTLTAISNASNIEWSTGETTESITVSESGWYTAIATNENGCQAIAEVFVNLTTSNINKPIWAANINLFPNPADDVVYLSGVPNKVSEIDIYSISGKLVKSYNKAVNEIETSNLPSGSYLVQFTTNTEQFSTLLIVTH